MILIIDNYDSFTYNLYQMIAEDGIDVRVVRNDALSVQEIEELAPQAIILSPGPGIPENAGICIDLVRALAPKIPILGVCLGLQAIAVAFGGRVIQSEQIKHGKTSSVFHCQPKLFQGLHLPFPAGRYHSLIVEREALPSELLIQAETDDGLIMALQHKQYPCYGLQFHPESVLTPQGKQIVNNFLREAVKPEKGVSYAS